MVDLRNAQRVKVQGYEAILADLNNIPKQIDKSAELATKDTSEEFYKKVYDFVSETKYSLQQLRKMDYPYARRHGMIRVIGIKPKERIHTRSGHMRKELSWKYLKMGNIHYGLIGWLSESPEDYFRMVLYGTRKMLPRPALELVWKLDDLIEFIRDRIIYYHNKGNAYSKRKTFEFVQSIIRSMAKNVGLI